MKLNNFSHDTSIIIGEMTKNKFGIIANDKMFHILSDKIYTDKILAPIRELAANAYDAHVDNNKKNIPFDVHLPTIDEPFFSIRDYGKGLNGEQIETLYTTYGWSDKNNSNKYVGCMGLGSKSPFAYINSFDVISINNGIKYIYHCYMEEGIPHIMKFDEFDSDEPSGLMIKFQVHKDDIYTFHSKSQSVFQWFDIKPNTNETLCYNDYLKEDNVIMCPQYHTGGILMGNIFYQDINFFNDYIKEKNLITPETEYFFKNCFSLILCAEIGEYDIAVSREQISKTEKNCQNIYNALMQFYHKQQKRYEKFLQGLKGTSIDKYHDLYKYISKRKFICINSWENDNIMIDFTKGKNRMLKIWNGGKIVNHKLDCKMNIVHFINNVNDCRIVCSNKTKEIYKQYMKDNSKHMFVVSEQEIYDKLINAGIKPADLSNTVVIKNKSTVDGKLYEINSRKSDYEYILNQSNKTIKQVLDEKGALFYIPFYKGKPEYLLKNCDSDWIHVLNNCSFFKHKIYATYYHETKKLKNQPHCYNVVDLLIKSFSNIQKFDHIKHIVNFKFVHGIEQIMCSCQC